MVNGHAAEPSALARGRAAGATAVALLMLHPESCCGLVPHRSELGGRLNFGFRDPRRNSAKRGGLEKMALAQTPTTATQKTMPVPNHLWSSVLLPDGLRLTATPRLPRPVYTPARFLSHVICQLGGAVAGLSILLLPSTAGVDSPRLQREPGAHTYQILRFCCRDLKNKPPFSASPARQSNPCAQRPGRRSAPRRSRSLSQNTRDITSSDRVTASRPSSSD